MKCKMCGVKSTKEFCSNSCYEKYLFTLESFVNSQDMNKVKLENRTFYELAKEYLNNEQKQ